jgi:two-component system phosphate regulon response regulator OmpR
MNIRQNHTPTCHHGSLFVVIQRCLRFNQSHLSVTGPPISSNFCNSVSKSREKDKSPVLALKISSVTNTDRLMTQASNTSRVDKILIVDDDARIRDLLRRYLTQEGFEVILAEDSKALNRIMMRDSVDLIVLDLMMPGEDGLSICRRLRAANDRTPIIMLTAKGEDVDRIVGLEVGADDYLAKPFNPRELLARIHAVLRRRPTVEVPGAPSAEQEVVNFGPFSFDMGLRTLQKNGEELPLTTGEFAMLKTLVRHPRQPLSREKLAQLARGREFEPFDRSLDVQVSRLRKLIEMDAAAPRYIQTVWGIGYVFVPDGTS